MTGQIRWSAGVVLCVMIGSAILGATDASAQFFGLVTTAQPLDKGTHDIGGFLGVYENSSAIFAQYRRGLFANGDGGLQFGFIDPEGGGDFGLGIAGDLKFRLMGGGRDPFDLALGVRSGIFDFDGISIFQFGGVAIISRNYALSEGGSLAPYAAANLRVEAVDSGKNNDTDLDIGAVAGLKWDMSQLLDAFGEVILDDEIGLVLGLNFKI